MPSRAPVEPYAKTRSAGTASFPLEVGVAPQALARPFRRAGGRRVFPRVDSARVSRASSSPTQAGPSGSGRDRLCARLVAAG
jgi:hypothetical protein